MMRLIDADYVLNKMETTDKQPITETERCAFEFAKALFQNAPTADVQPMKYGKWIDAGRNIKACSECNHGIQTHMAWVNKYCPNCGARMNGDKVDK